MRSEQVVTNHVCNQACVYCTRRSPADEPAFLRRSATIARIEGALATGAREIVLTGGEPTMRTDLAALVAAARAGGAERVVLETNATLLDEARARALAEAGLGLARVNLAAAGEALDAVTRDPGGFERTLAGIRALARAGVRVEIAVAVVAGTLEHVAALPARLALALGDDARALAGFVVSVPTESPDASALVAYPEAERAIRALVLEARRLELAVRMSADAAPPPCVFPQTAAIAHLYSLTRGATARADRERVPACARCEIVDRCGGLPRAYLARWPAPPMQPVTEERIKRRLSIQRSVEEQIARELVEPHKKWMGDLGEVEEALVRINFHCNQACRFCFVSTHLPPAGDAAVRAAIAQARARGQAVTLTGGEPTLNPSLAEYVRLAAEGSALPVSLQTNATRLGDDAAVAALVAAGLRRVLVSLHGSRPEISDAVTESPGTFELTVAGIDALRRAPVEVGLNFVMCRRNLGDLGAYVRFVAARWPGIQVAFSFVAGSSDVVPREASLIPRYSEVLPELAEALADARRLGLKLGSFREMCGLPLCLVPSGSDAFYDASDVPVGLDRGEFEKPEPCAGCALATKCFGVRRGYLELYGAGELRAVAASGAG